MGKGRDKRKDKRQERKGAIQAKKQRKEEKKMQKWERQQQKALQEAAEYDDVEALLAAYRHQKKVDAACSLEDSTIPAPRVNATLTIHPTNKHELVLFGGEYWSGKHIKMYNELLIYRGDKDQWRAVTGEYFPAPRSSHQAVNYKNKMYVFGGEFASPSQASNFHFHDLWSFDFKKLEWTEHAIRHGPSARSGHRMVVWKKSFVLFGGFYAAKSQADMTYFNDLWLLNDIEGAAEWQAAEYGPYDDIPKPRSGCCLGCYENTLFLFGGYSSETLEGGHGSRGITYMDLWQNTLPTLKWQRIRTQGIAPSIRSGMSVCLDRKRGLFFGGVWDYDDGEKDMQSEFHNDLYALNLESNRWFPVQLKAKGARPKAKHQKDDDEEGDEEEESNERSTVTMPRGRINALLAVAENKLYLYGGIYEEGNQEVTYNDLWVLNLNKLDGWKLIFDNTKAEWEGDDDQQQDTDSSSDEEEEEDTQAPARQQHRTEDVPAQNKSKKKSTSQTAAPEDSGTGAAKHNEPTARQAAILKEKEYELATTAAMVDRLLQDLSELDATGIPTPNPGEPLPAFYNRSKAFWVAEAQQAMMEEGLTEDDLTDELLGSDAMVLAKKRFGEVRPILERLEATQLKLQQLTALQESNNGTTVTASSSSSSRKTSSTQVAKCAPTQGSQQTLSESDDSADEAEEDTESSDAD